MAIPISVTYGSDLAKVMHLLLSVAASDSNILKDPAPAVGFQGFGESAINFELRFWTLVQSNVDIKSRVSITMAQTLAEAGIEIPVPQRDLRLRAMDRNIEGLISHGAVESGAIATRDEHPRK